MGEKLIDPSGIPHFIGDLATLDTDAANLTTHAGEFRTAGSDVHTEFQGLSACYQAPEAEQLFATTLPVQTKSDAFAGDLEKVSTALSDYSTEVQPLVTRLETLKADATAFVDSVAGDDDWRTDQDKVDHNNDLWHDVNHTVAAFQSAERTAYNKIMALIGGTALTTDDGSHGTNMYGFKADDLDHAEETPWGSSAEREYEGLAWLGHQIKSYVWDGFIVDGVWGTVKGLGTLVGTDGWDAAGQAWKHLAQLGTGLAISAIPVVGDVYWQMPEDKLPSWLSESRTTMKETGKALVAWDTWKTNPSRAAGQVTFNAVTAIFTGGTGSAASGAGKAGAVARTLSVAGKVGRIVDPMTYVGKAGKLAYLKIGDTFTTLKNLRTGATLDLLRQADATRSPAIPDTAIPYLDNATGKIVYLTDEGHLLNPDGTLHQHADQAPGEASAADRARIDAADGHAPVAAHAAADSVTHAEPASAGRAGGGAAQPLIPDTPVRHAGPAVLHGGGEAGHSGPPGRGPGGIPPGQHADDGLPAGKGWYDGLDPEQIKDVQVYRANHEPGYRAKYYQENGHRLRVAVPDESGFAPPQLARDPHHPGAWMAASDKAAPIPEKYVHGSKVEQGPETVRTQDDLDAIKGKALQRHASVTADNAWHDPVKDAKHTYKADPTLENLRAYEQIKAEHAPFHRAMSADSEAFGEAVAQHHVIPEHYPGAQMEELAGPRNGNDQFDQVWSRTDEHGVKQYIVIESKSTVTTDLGKRTLPNGFEARQGSREYFLDILRKMKQRGIDGNPNEKRLYKELSKALKSGNIEYILVKGKVTSAGGYAGYQKWTFDIR
ncbi:hypothetical protein [Streptomyces sp. NPDC003717]|uniref:hypothetical protein n=1 Tax=Streptomyces sp. NPDC003717 TaxID=3154276 RepID=UPI0033B79A30